MQWPTISCVLLACVAVSATTDESRSKRDLQYLKNLIASNIFGIHPNNNSSAPLLVQDDGNVKIYRLPGNDNLLVSSVPKNHYKIEQALPVPVDPAVDDTVTVLETYLGTRSIDETVTALQGIRNLLASGILIKPKPFSPLRPSKLPLIPVIPPADPMPIIQEVIPMKPLEYPEFIGVEVPNQYSYKQMKSDESMTTYTSRDGGDVIVTESKQPMPPPPPYIMERLKQVCMQPIPARPALKPVLMEIPRPVQYNVPMVPLPPPLPVISSPSDVNVKPFSMREEINVGPLVKETDIVVPGPPIMLPPMPLTIVLNKDAVGMEQSYMFRPHSSLIGPVPIGPYSSPHLLKAPHFFEPYRPAVVLNTKGEVKVERIPNKKGHHFLGSLNHQAPIRKPNPVVVIEKPGRTMPLVPLPVMKRLENVVALAHAVHPPKVSAAYSFRVGSDFKNVSISTDGSTVNKENIYESSKTTPSSNSYSYKQISSDGVTTFTGNEVNSNVMNDVGRLNTVSAIANQVGVVSESVKNHKTKLFTSPVSSSYVYKQINHNSAKPVSVGNKENLKGFETEHVYTHQHVLADGSKKLCDQLHVNPVEVENKNEKVPYKTSEFMYIPPIINEVKVMEMTPEQYSLPTAIPSEVKMPTVPVLKIDSEKLNITTNFSYKQLTDGGMLTNRNGNVEIKEFISNSPKSNEASETITTVKGTLTDNPIVVVEETFYTLKDKRDSSSSNGKRTSENLVSEEISDSTTTGHEKQRRGDIPDAMS